MIDHEVRRWKDGAAPLAGLSAATAALSARGANDAQLLRIEAALAPLLARPTRSVAPSAPGGAPTTLGWTRLGSWIAAVFVGLGALWSFAPVLRERQVAPHEPPAAHQPPAAALERPVAPAAEIEPRLEVIAPRIEAPARAARKPPKPAAKHAAANAAEAELELLRKAQSALNRSASRALALADEHAQAYPNGVFVQEREMLRIEGELRLGRRERALERVAQFAERFGRSTYQARIDRLLSAHDAMKIREASDPAGTQ